MLSRSTLAALSVLVASATATASEEGASATAACPPPVLLFLNFEGGRVYGSGDCEDAARGCSALVTAIAGSRTFDLPRFSGTGAERAEIVERVRRWYRPYNIQIVEERPASGPYEMVLIGGEARDLGLPAPTAGSFTAGVALRDCGNRMATNISFVFSDAEANDPQRVATAVAQESAHALGLSHVDDETDVMRSSINGRAEGFQNYAMPIAKTGGCPGSPCQNSAQLLAANVGMACDGGVSMTLSAPGVDACSIDRLQASAISTPQGASSTEPTIGCGLGTTAPVSPIALLFLLWLGWSLARRAASGD